MATACKWWIGRVQILLASVTEVLGEIESVSVKIRETSVGIHINISSAPIEHQQRQKKERKSSKWETPAAIFVRFHVYYRWPHQHIFLSVTLGHAKKTRCSSNPNMLFLHKYCHDIFKESPSRVSIQLSRENDPAEVNLTLGRDPYTRKFKSNQFNLKHLKRITLRMVFSKDLHGKCTLWILNHRRRYLQTSLFTMTCEKQNNNNKEKLQTWC